MRYRLQRHDGTDCSATMVPITVLRMVPIQRYRQYIGILLKKSPNGKYHWEKYIILSNQMDFDCSLLDLCNHRRYPGRR